MTHSYRRNMGKNDQKTWGISIHLLSKHLWKICQAIFIFLSTQSKTGENHTRKLTQGDNSHIEDMLQTWEPKINTHDFMRSTPLCFNNHIISCTKFKVNASNSKFNNLVEIQVRHYLQSSINQKYIFKLCHLLHNSFRSLFLTHSLYQFQELQPSLQFF